MKSKALFNRLYSKFIIFLSDKPNENISVSSSPSFSALICLSPSQNVYSEILPANAFINSFIRPEENYETLLEKVICYINLFIELKNIRFLAFVGLKSVLSDEDLRLLYRHCRLHKLSLLLVECGKIRSVSMF